MNETTRTTWVAQRKGLIQRVVEITGIEAEELHQISWRICTARRPFDVFLEIITRKLEKSNPALLEKLRKIRRSKL
jgi:hypothetical protein